MRNKSTFFIHFQGEEGGGKVENIDNCEFIREWRRRRLTEGMHADSGDGKSTPPHPGDLV